MYINVSQLLFILYGCYFFSSIGIFDTYIDKYKEIKMNSKGAMRELAKLFLNNLYGKLASSTDSSFKSYARNFTIRAAQMNYYGKDERGFIYADTDSIHCDLQPDEIKGIKVDPKEF